MLLAVGDLTKAMAFAIQESDSRNTCFARFVEVSRTIHGFSKLNIFCSFLEIFLSLRTICSGNTDQEMKIMVNKVEANYRDANASESLNKLINQSITKRQY